jgi:uncharacterized membrane protein
MSYNSSQNGKKPTILDHLANSAIVAGITAASLAIATGGQIDQTAAFIIFLNFGLTFLTRLSVYRGIK